MNLKEQLDALRAFVRDEHEANQATLSEVWDKALAKKLESGECQQIESIAHEGKNRLTLTLGKGESRFREGDMICLHLGDVTHTSFVRQATIEAEADGEWSLNVYKLDLAAVNANSGPCYADPDSMDQRPFFEKAFDDLATTEIGIKIILPLMNGQLKADTIYPDNYDNAADVAEKNDFNEAQIDAVGKGVGSQYLACIQGPPGTGKTKVISLIAKLLVEEGQTVLLTSHTHMAINNALNKIAKEGTPTAKIGALSTIKGLDKGIQYFENEADWSDKPDSGYVIGATPFATCSERLQHIEFDTVIFDEASQVTVPLALMAMRKAKRYVFVGDHKQLPPVVLSKSVLDKTGYSVFSALVLGNTKTSSMLKKTYRMNSSLSRWPSERFYNTKLESIGDNANRQLMLPQPLNSSHPYADVLSSSHPFVFIRSPGVNTRTSSPSEAQWVVDIIGTAMDAGLALDNIGVVTLYRKHAKKIKNALADKLGIFTAQQVVTDTVERMQGQEREMIIWSLCSTDVQFISAMSSFFFQPERLNVAITRAMTKLIVIGPVLPAGFTVNSANQELLAAFEGYQSLVASAHTVSFSGVEIRN